MNSSASTSASRTIGEISGSGLMRWRRRSSSTTSATLPSTSALTMAKPCGAKGIASAAMGASASSSWTVKITRISQMYTARPGAPELVHHDLLRFLQARMPAAASLVAHAPSPPPARASSSARIGTPMFGLHALRDAECSTPITSATVAPGASAARMCRDAGRVHVPDRGIEGDAQQFRQLRLNAAEIDAAARCHEGIGPFRLEPEEGIPGGVPLPRRAHAGRQAGVAGGGSASRAGRGRRPSPPPAGSARRGCRCGSTAGTPS